jgi:hypothetical protein
MLCLRCPIYTHICKKLVVIYNMMISQENFDESMPAMMNEHAVKRTVDDVSAEVMHTKWEADAQIL